jgi:hypothetical protein
VKVARATGKVLTPAEREALIQKAVAHKLPKIGVAIRKEVQLSLRPEV